MKRKQLAPTRRHSRTPATFKDNKDKERDAMATAIEKLNSACIELGSINVSCMRAAGQVVVAYE